MTQSSVSKPRQRIVFLDWMRGVAALIMLQGHTFHSFIRPELRENGIYRFSQFMGGEAAAIFLFLTGVTYGLGMGKRDHLPASNRILAALKRARYLLMIGVLFRAQMWLFGLPFTRLSDLLIVDVLNLMGASAAVLAVIAYSKDPLQRVRWGVLAGLAMTFLAPVVQDWSDAGAFAMLPKFITDYIVPGTSFSIFPWGAFLAFGMACGNAIPLVQEGGWNRVMQWAGITGGVMAFGGLYFSSMEFSIYPSAQFWVDSPAQIACKLGALLIGLSGAFLWTEYFSSGWSFVRLLGTTSLPVYWVHVELVYGRWFWFFKEKFEVWQCIAFAVPLILAMIGMAHVIRNTAWKPWIADRVMRLRSRPVVAPELQ